MEMGCYGIGVTRIVAAAIEQNHDAARHHLARSRSRRSRSPSRRSATIATKRVQERSPTACTTSWKRPASTCCWTTAASALA